MGCFIRIMNTETKTSWLIRVFAQKYASIMLFFTGVATVKEDSELWKIMKINLDRYEVQ